MRWSGAVAGFFAVMFLAAPSALACYDNSDEIMVRLQELDMSRDLLDRVFAMKEAQQGFIRSCHAEHRGCKPHEDAETAFEATAIGYLGDAQFQTYTGRERTETESLRHENLLLQVRIEQLEKELAELRAAIAAQSAPQEDAPAQGGNR